jgi:hypothetical protein
MTSSSTLRQAGMLDPYIYVAFIHDYPATLERFGRTYYSTRIAYIYPERALAHVFGLVPGYYVFRFIEFAVAAASTFALGLRYFGYRCAFFATAWICFTPWLPRELFLTMYDGTAVVYFLLAIAILLTSAKRGAMAYATAGSLGALAVNCYPTMLAVAGLLAPGLMVVHKRHSRTPLVFCVLTALAGFVLTYLVLMVALYVEFPDKGFIFDDVTIRVALDQLRGGAATWHIPLAVTVLELRYFALLIPPTLLVVAIVLFPNRRTKDSNEADCADFALVAAPYLAAIIALALVFHFVFHAGFLSVPTGVIYFLPACMLVLIFICGRTERLGGPVLGSLATLGGGVLIFLLWLAHPYVSSAGIESSPYLWVALAALATAAAVWLRWSAIAALVLMACIAVLPLSFYQFRRGEPGPYEDLSAEDSQFEWDVYRGALFLREFVNAKVPMNQPVWFWYRSGPKTRALDSIQSTFLWGYTRLTSARHIVAGFRDTVSGGREEANTGMPHIDEEFKEAASRRRFVVLLGLSGDEIDTGLAALRTAGFSYREIERSRYHGKVWGYTAAVVTLKPPERPVGPLLFTLPLSSLQPNNGGNATSTKEGLELITAQPQWAYSLMGPLSANRDSSNGPAVVRVSLHVEQGSIGISVSAVGDISTLTKEAFVSQSEENQVADIPVPDVNKAGLLIFRNASPKGASRAVIQRVEVHRAE